MFSRLINCALVRPFLMHLMPASEYPVSKAIASVVTPRF